MLVEKFLRRCRKEKKHGGDGGLPKVIQRLNSCNRPVSELSILYVFIVLAPHLRHAIHFNVTTHPTAEWTAQQIAEAFPWDSAPSYLLHDRDCIYGETFHQRVEEMAIREILTAPRAPWQNPYAERFIGSLRRECLDHIIAFNESSLRRIVKAYFEYYEHSRTYLALDKDAPASRPIQPPGLGTVIELPQRADCIIVMSEELPEGTFLPGQYPNYNSGA